VLFVFLVVFVRVYILLVFSQAQVMIFLGWGVGGGVSKPPSQLISLNVCLVDNPLFDLSSLLTRWDSDTLGNPGVVEFVLYIE